MIDLKDEIATAERDLKDAETAVTASYLSKKNKKLGEARQRRDRAQILLANLKSELTLLNAETVSRSRAVSGSETAAVVVERRDIVKRARSLRFEIYASLDALFVKHREYESLFRRDRALYQQLHKRPQLQQQPVDRAVHFDPTIFQTMQKLLVRSGQLRAGGLWIGNGAAQ